jgi:hypothetical protein
MGKVPGTSWVRGLMGSRDRLDAVEKEEVK